MELMTRNSFFTPTAENTIRIERLYGISENVYTHNLDLHLNPDCRHTDWRHLSFCRILFPL